MTAWDYVLFTGQSLARGQATDGTFDLAGAQANPNYIKQANANGVLSPMQAPDPFYSYAGIVPARSFADAAWKGTSQHLVVNNHSEGGLAYASLKKGSNTYNAAIDAITDAVSANAPDTFTARALHIIHGEADYSGGASQAAYFGYLQEWLSDYNTDIKAVTGQSSNMVAFFSPPSYYGLNNITAAGLQAQRETSNIFLVGPKYNLEGSDQIHLTSVGYYHLGEYHARAHRAVVNNGGSWKPLMPVSAIANGTTITVDFAVPVRPIVFDTTAVAAVSNQGFVVLDNSGTKTISSVSIAGETTVQIVVTTSLGANPRVRYAVGSQGGNLRDSETAVSAYDGKRLPNWCVHFEQSISPIPQSPRTAFRSVGVMV